MPFNRFYRQNLTTSDAENQHFQLVQLPRHCVNLICFLLIVKHVSKSTIFHFYRLQDLHNDQHALYHLLNLSPNYSINLLHQNPNWLNATKLTLNPHLNYPKQMHNQK